jgi:hypothetical protein
LREGVTGLVRGEKMSALAYSKARRGGRLVRPVERSSTDEYRN